MVRIGVISVQGDVSEHLISAKRAMEDFGIVGEVVAVRRLRDIEGVDALIIPGGESTTISRIMKREGLMDRIRELHEERDIPIMGTCAGCIILAKEARDGEVDGLKLMDMRVRRNAFGRQRESFETSVEVEGFDSPFHAVFIRAPIIEAIWGRCRAIAKLNDRIVGAVDGRKIALTFHPELTSDYRFHRMFLEMI
ncbi:MAG: pyridoxal 5'-phosphate synthase glutaminase subunit PdxT [Thermoplasmata archaeon]|nr:MAG: pyridoxal 5'-phosphate synthase glutaminase subunit PdxT [Thermoplasmata archaeon]